MLSTMSGNMFSARWFNECFREDADAVGAEIDGRSSTSRHARHGSHQPRLGRLHAVRDRLWC
jgi:hypothetical protein